MAYETILIEKEGGVLIVTFNRPDKMNAANVKLLQESAKVLQESSGDDEVKAIILTGSGRAFCSGADVTDHSGICDLPKPDFNRNIIIEPFMNFGWLVEQIENCPKPIIAAVNGIASGAGLAIVCACDIRIASESARFSSIFVKRGIIPDAGTTYYLPRLVGANKALEMMWSGEFVDAQKAERIGLVNRVVPADDLMGEAKEYAMKLAEGPSIAIELTKRLVRDSMSASSLRTQMANESSAQALCTQTEDVKEGITAFLEKREPKFKGR